MALHYYKAAMELPSSLLSEFEKADLDYEAIKNKIVVWYNACNQEQLPVHDQLSDEQKDAVVVWLHKNFETVCTIFSRRRPALQSLFHITLSSKISSIGQHHCPICTATFPISVIPIRIRPQSYQCADATIKAAFKAALLHRFTARPMSTAFFEKKICLHIVFVMMPGRKDKDVDNMAKLLLDGLKNVIFSDDKNIVHLSIVKIRQQDAEEYIYINLRESRLPSNKDVFSERMNHSWAGDEMLELDDFIARQV